MRFIVYFAFFQDRSLWLQWVQDLPGPWPNSCEARWQGKSSVLEKIKSFPNLKQSFSQLLHLLSKGLQIFGWPYHEGPSSQEKSPKSNVDCTLQTQAQEGYRRGGCQEAYQEDSKVPKSSCWSHTPRHYG